MDGTTRPFANKSGFEYTPVVRSTRDWSDAGSLCQGAYRGYEFIYPRRLFHSLFKIVLHHTSEPSLCNTITIAKACIMKGVQATVLAALAGLAQANSDIVSLYTSGSAYITEASATLVLPKLPNPVSGDVAIWSAIMMENQASFLQGVTSNSPSG